MSKHAQFFAILKEAQNAGLKSDYRQVVFDFTEGRTNSLSSLTELEIEALKLNLKKLTYSGSGTKPDKAYYDMVDSTRNKMRRAIIAQFKSIGGTTANAINWAEKYGVFGRKKAVNEYDEQELWQLIRNEENVKDDFINSVINRKK